MKTVKFLRISQNEVVFTYKDKKLLLQENKVGVYGLGRCVSLYEVTGLTKTFVKCIGWTATDNHGGPSKECILRGIVKPEDCQQPALSYIKSLLD